MEKSIRLQDIAELLNLSISTISKALNDSPEISSKTKNRVKELAILKQYIPNNMAQSLKGKQSRTIGVIIPDIFSNFFSEALHAIENKANKRGYHTIICFSNGSVSKESECFDRLIKCRVDGIIIAVSKQSLYKKVKEHIDRILNFKLPIVMFDCIEDYIVCDKVGLNETFLAEEATMNLVDSGYQNIAFFSASSANSIDLSHRKGYKEAVNRVRVKSNIFHFDYEESSYQDLQDFIHTEHIDAFLVNDKSSAYVIENSFSECNTPIPENFRILSLYNSEEKESLSNSYNFLDRQGREQGDIAVDTLIDRIEGVLPDEFLKFELNASIKGERF